MSNRRAVELISHGITEPGPVHWNLEVGDLLKRALEAGEGKLLATGALSCTTGIHTGRSPKDKFIVRDTITESAVHWGSVNAPLSPEYFAILREDQRQYLKGKELYVRDAAAGADPSYTLPIRVITENAWTNLFARHLFLRLTPTEALENIPQFTIIHTPGFSADPQRHGTQSGTFIVVNFSEGLVLIGGTEYAGEIKKSIFSILNFLYPERNVFPMHCSATIAKSGPEKPALFFGLSGTGKTTLSADPHRRLIGDDEHGWSAEGIFNFEGGCYAKCIRLSQEVEPQIWNAVRDGAILENVVVNDAGIPDYNDASLTENTRVAYPVDFIDQAVLEGRCGHPTSIVFLTCDAFGVMPPISRLSPEQAMYHFLSGYTAKVAGTEKGMGTSPSATFSACFGAPFLPRRAKEYAEMLGRRMKEHAVECWLVNTGWIGGAFGEGTRIKLPLTRAMVAAAVDGQLRDTVCNPDPVFGLGIPTAIPGVPEELLNPRNQWSDVARYDEQAQHLAGLFRANFKQFEAENPELVRFGP